MEVPSPSLLEIRRTIYGLSKKVSRFRKLEMDLLTSNQSIGVLEAIGAMATSTPASIRLRRNMLGGLANLPRESEIKFACVPDEVRSGAGHRGGRADPTPPSPLRRIELHLPIGINPALPIVAHWPSIMREYARGTTLTLKATTAADSTFISWSGKPVVVPGAALASNLGRFTLSTRQLAARHQLFDCQKGPS